MVQGHDENESGVRSCQHKGTEETAELRWRVSKSQPQRQRRPSAGKQGETIRETHRSWCCSTATDWECADFVDIWVIPL